MTAISKLRFWQEQALNHYLSLNPKTYLAEVTPAGGKTRFALALGKTLLDRREIRQIVIVVHTDHLRYQWIQESRKLGWNLTTYSEYLKKVEHRRSSFTLPIGELTGFVLTYQQLESLAGSHQFQAIVGGKNWWMCILDEIHHASEHKSWGTSLRSAFLNVHRRLLLSGTPFRHDDGKIPFVKYKHKVGQPDFYYGYDEALKDGIVAPIFFPTFGGSAHWKFGDNEFKTDFGSQLSQINAARQLNTALNSRDWVKSILAAAHDRLSEIRQYQPNAGGLIVTRDQAHARFVARILSQITGEKPITVMSDIDESQELISQFQSSNAPWLVSVKMVSEGVDIPRLRVGVYATNTRTELFFRQVVGRLIRLAANVEDQSVYLYLPRHPQLVKYAQEIAEQRQHTLRVVEQRKPVQSADDHQFLLPVSALAAIESTLMPGGEFTSEELANAQRVREASGMWGIAIEAVAKILRAQASLVV
jgi:superfamily II DNA or RNA helicase